MTGKPALLIVDVQNDFCPGGALPVPEGDRVVPALNVHLRRAAEAGWTVYASRDWHPPATRHFRPAGPWPPHCVQNTEGARFRADLALPPGTIVITKGQSTEDHGYSAFDGTTPEGRTLLDDLRTRGIDHLYVGGLATDYCVEHSVLDARRHGMRVTLLTEAIAGVEVHAGDSRRALDEMRAAGAET